MVMSMIPKTTRERIGIVTAKISAERTSMVNAMIIAPNTTNGERRRSRSVRLSPDCT